MFVQIITGRTTNPGALKEQMKRWERELRPGAIGFVGSTAGVTDDGRFVALARFSSAESAQRNSDRPEQTSWWQQTEQYLSDVQFRDCKGIDTYLEGGSDEAEFVQVIQGRIKDERAYRDLFTTTEELRSSRPDLLGSYSVLHGDGGFTEVAYFTNEEEARRGEAQVEFKRFVDEFNAATTDVEFFDLREPMLSSP